MRLTPGEQIEIHFTHHAPTPEQIVKYLKLRDAAKTYALVLAECCPPSADLTAAIRKVRESVMTANASIACKGQ